MRIEVLIDLKTRLGESPLWDVEQQRLYWVDSQDGRLFSCTDQGAQIKAWDVRQKIGSFALRQDGDGAVVALQHGIHTLDFASGELQLIHDPEADKPNNRLNDGKVDRQGRFIFGSMDMLEQEASAALYRLDGDFSLHHLQSGIIVSNAPCWSPAGDTFYFADTWSGEIRAWDYDTVTGNLANGRTFCRVDDSEGGAADGATVDSEGCLWNALVYAGKLVRYTPDGEVDRIIEMPVKKVTSVMFGGEKLDVLYVTSMAQPPLPRFPEDNQLRGSLFAIYGLGVTGVAERRFAG
ncbi:SMP-30/gluconolactonase/LRE family protein [Affinibrenneria salicis]|uniref:SMP-30/gluconolactonase/LRE family protein n=1 Tax=Affinibrenneria salicis TaxID=2590031 RepID=A0A5J5G3H8_9GAMM|nr:SMP-30/gluconolactonase/LRE family protein [Affinibrenneria salicis]KAA9001386.1 SMP-30/gluconolactonase/LRE family protein [Affinibrenneria salicis]